MKASEIIVGEDYRGVLSGRPVIVRVTGIKTIPTADMRYRKFREKPVYVVTVVETGRELVFRSPARFKERV